MGLRETPAKIRTDPFPKPIIELISVANRCFTLRAPQGPPMAAHEGDTMNTKKIGVSDKIE